MRGEGEGEGYRTCTYVFRARARSYARTRGLITRDSQAGELRCSVVELRERYELTARPRAKRVILMSARMALYVHTGVHRVFDLGP